MAIVADNVLKELLKAFPAKYCYAFAYGSAVFAQKNQQPGKMTDLIFVVDNPLDWHSENIQMNSRHYSGLRIFGPKFISALQEKMACGVYYNPYCKIDGKIIKYGVISTSSLEQDLRQWKHLYIAGRLHKPVLDLYPPSHPSLVESIKKNRQTALRTALLQKGRFMSKFELYHSIAEISYLGDTRMRFAENPDKCKNIVTPLMPEFDRIYTPLLNEIPSLAITSDGSIAQDIGPSARYKNLIALPIPIQISLVRASFKDPRFVDIEQVLADLSYLPNLNFFIKMAIAEIVRGSSILQTAQGFFSAGILRSSIYALDKLKKGIAARKSNPQQISPSSLQPQKHSVVPPIISSDTKDHILISPSSKSSSFSPSLNTTSPGPVSTTTNTLNSNKEGVVVMANNESEETLSSALAAVVPAAGDSEDAAEKDKSNSNSTDTLPNLEKISAVANANRANGESSSGASHDKLNSKR